MKQTLLSFAVLVVLSPVFAFADTATTTPNGNGNPFTVSQVWGLTGAETPIISAGSTTVDTHGVTVFCDRLSPCSDLTRTSYYINSMLALARQLIASGQAARFPMFAGWVSAVR